MTEDRGGAYTQAIPADEPGWVPSVPTPIGRPATGSVRGNAAATAAAESVRRVSGTISIEKPHGKPLSGIVGIVPEESADSGGKRLMLAVGIVAALLVFIAAAFAGRWTGGLGGGSTSPIAVATPGANPDATRVAIAVPTATQAGSVSATVEKKGKLTVYAKPWCQVFVDGKKVSDETPLENFRISSGKRVLRFENPALKIRVEKTIDVKPGAEIEMYVDVPAKKATVTKTR